MDLVHGDKGKTERREWEEEQGIEQQSDVNQVPSKAIIYVLNANPPMATLLGGHDAGSWFDVCHKWGTRQAQAMRRVASRSSL
jgi:hypothetical protein